MRQVLTEVGVVRKRPVTDWEGRRMPSGRLPRGRRVPSHSAHVDGSVACSSFVEVQ